MNTILRLSLSAALLAALAACGNKGPLVQAGAPEAQDTEAAAAEQPVTETPAPAAADDAVPAVPVDEKAPTPAEPPPPPPVEDDGVP